MQWNSHMSLSRAHYYVCLCWCETCVCVCGGGGQEYEIIWEEEVERREKDRISCECKHTSCISNGILRADTATPLLP